MRNATVMGLSSIAVPSLPNPFPSHPPQSFPLSSSFITLKLQPLNSLRFSVFAANNNNNGIREKQEQEQPKGNGNVDDSGKQQRPIFSFNWNALLDPDPDNVLALGLTALLTWASAQVLWQLLFVSLAILLAALKYSFIAALLIFILITLL